MKARGETDRMLLDHVMECVEYIDRMHWTGKRGPSAPRPCDGALSRGLVPLCSPRSRGWLEKRVSAWTRERFMPVLRALATDAGLIGEPSQLPTKLPESF